MKATDEMTREEIVAEIQALDAERVRRVYTGKAHKCRCGCAGTYRYNPMFLADESSRRGYPISLDEVNFTQIKKVVRILKEHSVDAEIMNGMSSERIYDVEIDGKIFSAYTVVEEVQA